MSEPRHSDFILGVPPIIKCELPNISRKGSIFETWEFARSPTRNTQEPGSSIRFPWQCLLQGSWWRDQWNEWINSRNVYCSFFSSLWKIIHMFCLFLCSLLAESASQDSGQEHQIPAVPVSLKQVQENKTWWGVSRVPWSTCSLREFSGFLAHPHFLFLRAPVRLCEYIVIMYGVPLGALRWQTGEQRAHPPRPAEGNWKVSSMTPRSEGALPPPHRLPPDLSLCEAI